MVHWIDKEVWAEKEITGTTQSQKAFLNPWKQNWSIEIKFISKEQMKLKIFEYPLKLAVENKGVCFFTLSFKAS